MSLIVSIWHVIMSNYVQNVHYDLILLRKSKPDRHCSSINIHSLLLCKNSRACCHFMPDSFIFFFPDRQLEVIAFCINASLLTGVYVRLVCVRAHVLSVCLSVCWRLISVLVDRCDRAFNVFHPLCHHPRSTTGQYKTLRLDRRLQQTYMDKHTQNLFPVSVCGAPAA